MTAPTKKAILLDGYEAGDMGDVEFVELALEAGDFTLEEIETALAIHRCDLGLSEETRQ